jgi:integrase
MNKEFKILVERFYFEEMSSYSSRTKESYQTAINHFLARIGKRDRAYFTKQDILRYLNSEKLNKLEISTQNLYKRFLKKFFKWYGIEESFLQKIKKKREQIKEIRKSDLVSLKDVQTMLNNTDNLQHKCLLILNYETAARINETRHIRIEDITQYEQYASVFIGVSKTQQRNLPIIQSIPYINQWLNNHPLRQNKKAYLFIGKYHGSYQQYSTPGLYLIFKNCGVCLDKNVYPHLFRHSRITELAKYLTEAELCRFAGWVIGSKQVRRYVHLAQEDVENKILSIHGIKSLKQPEQKAILDVIKCPRCTYENSSLDKYCSRCGSVLDIKTVIKHQEKARELEEIIGASEIKQYIDKLFDEKVFKILDKKKE